MTFSPITLENEDLKHDFSMPAAAENHYSLNCNKGCSSCEDDAALTEVVAAEEEVAC
jgi:hypothetical protein